MAHSYTVGQMVNFTIEYKLASTGAYVDPTTVTFRIKTPASGVVTSYVFPVTIVKTDVGRYNVDHVLDFPGDWFARWEGAGAYVGAEEWRVYIQESEF